MFLKNSALSACQVAMWHHFVPLRSEMADGFASLEGLHLCVWLLRPWPWPWGCQACKCWMMLNGWFLSHDNLKYSLRRLGSTKHLVSRHKSLHCPLLNDCSMSQMCHLWYSSTSEIWLDPGAQERQGFPPWLQSVLLPWAWEAAVGDGHCNCWR